MFLRLSMRTDLRARLKGIGVALLASLVLADSADAACLQYGPTIVTVSGKIFLRTDFGPPGYGEDPAHDSREQHIYIKLDKAICVEPSNGDGDLSDEPEAGLDTLEMVYFSEIPFQRVWLGKHVLVTGTLFHAFTGHHWTRVLITPSETHILSGRQPAK